MLRAALLQFGLGAVVLAGSSDAAAQAVPQPTGTSPTASGAADPVAITPPVDLVRWFYPRGERRDPVVPPEALYSGDGFPSLMVSAILYDPDDPRDSRALVQMNGAEPVRRVVRAGDRVGGFTIERVERGRVLVRVETLGSARVEALLPMRGNAVADSPR